MELNQATSSSSGPSRRKVILAWSLYDWANSAYSTISITLLFFYIREVVFPEREYGNIGGVVWAWGISLSMLIAAVLSPITGAIADAHASKHRWLSCTALAGALCCLVLAVVPPQLTWTVAGLFVLASLFFELSLGYYNAFLPEIADESDMDRVSALGYALGYVGGGLALILALLVLTYGDRFGIEDKILQLRVGLVIMGLWWGIFSLPTLLVLRDPRTPRSAPMPLHQATRAAMREVGGTLRNIRAFGTLALFLLGFLFYNDGIQTVISQADQFARDDLGFEAEEFTGVVLMIQFLAMPGALLVGWLAGKLGQKPTLVGCLVIWIGLLGSAYWIDQKWHFWVLGVVLALVMGGTQSVSRSIMGMMTPRQNNAEFFGFFNFSGKATSLLGTFSFGLVIHLTGRARLAVLSLLVFFIAGLAIICFLDFARGRREARAAEQGDEN